MADLYTIPAAVPWALTTERARGKGHVSNEDVINRAVRFMLAASGYDPDDATFPGLVGPVCNVKAFGAVGDGVADDTVPIMAANAAAALVNATLYFPAGTYLVSTVTGAKGRWVGDGATLKHLASAADSMVIASDSLYAQGLTFDGNKASQTGRYYALEAAYGGKPDAALTVCDCDFVHTVSASVAALNVLGQVRIKWCRFRDAAVHGGITGETSYGVYVTSAGQAELWIDGNDFTFDETPIDANTHPGGIILSGVALTASICNNYFRRIGQRNAANFTGCIHSYTDADRTVVIGNRFDDYAYVAIDLQNCKKVVCALNIVASALDTSALQAITVSYARDFGEPVDDVIVQGNILHPDGNIGIVVQGDPSFPSRRVTLTGNTVHGAGSPAVEVRDAADVVLAGNIITDPAGIGVSVRNITGDVMIEGGLIAGCGSRGVQAITSVTGLTLTISDVRFRDNTTNHVHVDDAAVLVMQDCRMSGTPTTGIAIDTVTEVRLVGNSGNNVTAITNVANFQEHANSWQPTRSPTGATWVETILEEEVTLNTGGTTTDSVADLLPANSEILAVTFRVTATITTATNWGAGDATTAARFVNASTELTAADTVVGLRHRQGSISTDAAGPVQTAAAKLRITTNANPGAGKIRVTVFARVYAAATN